MSENTPSSAGPNEAYGCDTEDLLLIHAVFRNAFGRASGLIETADASGPARVKLIADHLKEGLKALHDHHSHEDILWWELLKQRAPESTADVERMQRHHAEIAVMIDRLNVLTDAWQRDPQKKEALQIAFNEFKTALFTHLDDEEANIKPVAGRVLTQKEWNKAREIGTDEVPRDRLLFQIGYMLRCAPTEALRQEFWHAMPVFVRLLYNLLGKRKFEAEWQELYGEG